MDVLYYFWNKLICEDDETFIHFFIVSLIEYYTEEIICADLSHIPSLISMMNLKDLKMVDEIFENAKKLRAITPYSFKLFFGKMEIFNPYCAKTRHKEIFDLYKPDSILCLPIMPSEIFYITYNNLLRCPDEQCENFIDKKALEEYNEIQNYESNSDRNLENFENSYNLNERLELDRDYNCKDFYNQTEANNDYENFEPEEQLVKSKTGEKIQKKNVNLEQKQNLKIDAENGFVNNQGIFKLYLLKIKSHLLLPKKLLDIFMAFIYQI